jgi:hypothetical protein
MGIDWKPTVMILAGVIAQGAPVVPVAPVVSISSTSTYTTQEYGGSNEPDITVYWKTFNFALTTPANGGSPILSGIADYSVNGGATWTSPPGSNPYVLDPYPSTWSYTIQAGDQISFRWAAVNAIGRGAYSNIIALSYNPYA